MLTLICCGISSFFLTYVLLWACPNGCGLLKVVGSDGDALVSHSESLVRCMRLCVDQIRNKRAAKHVSKVIRPFR